MLVPRSAALIWCSDPRQTSWFLAYTRDLQCNLGMAGNNNEDYPFFFGNISRDDADQLLHPRYDGLFLIRDNQHHKGDYSLSVVYNNSSDSTKQPYVEHYWIKIIKEKANKLTIDDEVYFNSLHDLVVHYKADADGLITRLTLHVRELPSLLQKEKLERKSFIEKGNFSEVYEGVYDGKIVAIKVLKDHNAAREYLFEANVMMSLDHPNLVKLIGIVQTDSLNIVMEFMAKGSLLDYLRSRGRNAITPQELLKFVKDTCAGMAYLESKNIVHRDLAARNILLDEDGSAKVADFGLARAAEEPSEKQPEGKIAIRWTAPEACLRKEFSSKSDVWSFGIVLWEIYTFGRVPYPRILIADVMKHLESGLRLDPPEGCPTEVQNMMKRTWNLVPAERPSFKQLLDELSLLTP